MRTHFHYNSLLILAVTVALTAANVRAQDQPVPDPSPAPAAGDNTLPPGIDPASPTAQVIKLAQSGSDVSVINAYVANSPGNFNLDADAIISLKDAGVPTEVINGMLNHNKSPDGSTPAPAAEPAPAPAYTLPPTPAPDPVPDTTMDAPQDNSQDATPGDSPDMTAPAAPVTDEYFDNTLSPYGSWVDVEGYGRCWRPTEVIYNTSWNPYCDRGHWVYSDCGWYWNSDYAWGATFHYGRWFRDARDGWCWRPDTEWAPSWVVWRSANDYCGWAPLPPFAVFTPGIGFSFRGASVGAEFDFGLGANAFVFLSPGHLCDRRPRSFCVDRAQAGEIFRRTTIINHFDVHNRTIVNTGIPVARISAESHRNIEAVRVGALPTARREGWRGPVVVRQVDHRSFSTGNSQFHGNTPGHYIHNDNHPANFNANPHPNNNPAPVNRNGNQFNNHPQSFITPRTPAPTMNDTFNNHQNSHLNQNQNQIAPTHPAPAPRAPAPKDFAQPAAVQHGQQNGTHAFNGRAGNS